MAVNSVGGGLSNSLHTQFVDWVEQRKPQELAMLQNYNDKMRIFRGPEPSTGLPASNESRVFSGLTRGKIRTARAKIKDLLFGSGKMPFDSEPSQESLEKYAEIVEDILTYQLDAMKWDNTVSLGIDDLATYGTGFILGPFARGESYELMDRAELKSRKISFTAPYFDRASPMDGYPDPDAETIEDGKGFYWGARKSPEFIRSLLGRPGYNDDAISYALTQLISFRTDEGSDLTKDSRQNMYRYSKEGRIWFLRYFGLVSVKELAEWNGQDAMGVDVTEMVEAIVILAGGVVIKADVNPYHMMKRPVYRCAYEDEPGEVWGTGIAQNNNDNLNIKNACWRLYLEGKAYALLKMCSIDLSKYLASEDFKVFPGKRFLMKPNLTPEERKTATIWHDIVDVTGGWENAMELADQFSDDDTGISKYTQGTDSDSINKTATGISMIMGASAIPLKEVILNIDESWISPQIKDLLQWDLQFLEPETVGAFLGAEAAQAWAVIKEYGKTSFVTLKATGSSTFMMREVLMTKLSGFMEVTLGNPATAQYIDIPEMLSQVWEAAEIGGKSPILTNEEVQQKAQMELQASQQPVSQQAASELPEESAQDGGIEQMAPPGPPPGEVEKMEAAQSQQRLEDLLVRLVQDTESGNRLLLADKIPVRNPETGLIERIRVVERE